MQHKLFGCRQAYTFLQHKTIHATQAWIKRPAVLFEPPAYTSFLPPTMSTCVHASVALMANLSVQNATETGTTKAAAANKQGKKDVYHWSFMQRHPFRHDRWLECTRTSSSFHASKSHVLLLDGHHTLAIGMYTGKLLYQFLFKLQAAQGSGLVWTI
eukprot:1158839-Pelagomonas_calceolata.AAC.2